jgi:hypothetical protein
MRESVSRRRTALLGEETAGLSPTTITRLMAEREKEHTHSR